MKQGLTLVCGHGHTWAAQVETDKAPEYDRDLIEGATACRLCGEGYQLDKVVVGKVEIGKPEVKADPKAEKKDPEPED